MPRSCSWIVIALAIGCGGTAPPVRPPPSPVPAEPAAAACPTAESFPLADGRFRCRELPFEVEFPAGSTIQRLDNEWVTWFSAKLEHGVLAVAVIPKMALRGAPLEVMVEGVVRGGIPDATTTRRDMAPVAGTDAAVTFAIASPEGGIGEVRGYFVGPWMIAVIAGGTAELPTRPDGPLGARLLASFRPRAPDAGLVRLDLVDGAHIDIPRSAWPKKQVAAPEKETRGLWAFRLPDLEGVLGVRDLVQADVCTRLAAARDDNLEAAIRLIFSDQPIELRRVERGRLGDASAFLEVVTDGLNEAAYLICHGKSLIQLSVFGRQDHATLRVRLDEIGKTFVGAR